MSPGLTRTPARRRAVAGPRETLQPPNHPPTHRRCTSAPSSLTTNTPPPVGASFAPPHIQYHPSCVQVSRRCFLPPSSAMRTLRAGDTCLGGFPCSTQVYPSPATRRSSDIPPCSVTATTDPNSTARPSPAATRPPSGCPCSRHSQRGAATSPFRRSSSTHPPRLRIMNAAVPSCAPPASTTTAVSASTCRHKSTPLS